MRSAILLTLGVVLCFFVVAACSDDPSGLTRPDAARLNVIASSQSLDQSIRTLLELFPKKRANQNDSDGDGEGRNLNLRATWDQITRDYAEGETKPQKIEKAKKRLFKLSDWVTRNSELMNDPPDSETKTAAAARLVLYMSLYVYGGPATPTPAYAPEADAVVGVVTPDAPATIVTPTLHAGVQFEAGSVDENTVIVVTQNPAPFPDECSGPLQTRLCQYPLFYTFEQFPAKVLLKAAKVNVCHVNSGERRLPLADHDRFRLAHSLPADPGAYTPGSTIRDQNGESIEVLPLVEQTFSVCEETSYAANDRGHGIVSRLARGIRNIVTPKTAYAVDKGLGGLVKSFSPFNIIDPQSSPDLVVSSATFSDGPVHPGDHVVASYTIANNGTAASTTVPTAIRLSTDGVLTNSDTSLGSIALPALPPGGSFTGSQEVVVPASASPGSYHLGVLIGNEPAHPDLNIEDNQSVTATTVAPSFLSLPITLTVGATTVCALTPTSAGYCWGSNSFRQFGTTTATPASSLSPIPTPISGLATFAGGSSSHLCGIDGIGVAKCWGRNSFGEVGNGTNPVGASSPVIVVGGISWRTINVGRITTCGVSSSDVGYCWGTNQRGEIGSVSIPVAPGSGSPAGSHPTPVLLDGGHAWKTVVAGWLHACGITTTGAAYCWGDNRAGQLGIGTADVDPHRVPTPVATDERFVQLSLGGSSTCGITVNHKAFCWGENGTGQIGDGTTAFKPVPTAVAGGYRFSYIAASPGFADGTSVTLPVVGGLGGPTSAIAHTCALEETGRIYCWGWNGAGQLGDGSTIDRLTPVPVTGNLVLTSVGLGGSSTCGRRGNQVWCWGSNLTGQLGNATQTDSPIPTGVAFPFASP